MGLRGAQPSSVFYVCAAVHGDEVNGVEILSRFANEIDLQELQGSVLLVPVQNPLAFHPLRVPSSSALRRDRRGVQHRYFIGHPFKSPMDQGADHWTTFPAPTAT